MLPRKPLILGISYDLWVGRYGADPGIVGQTIEIDRQRYTVVGVARPGFHFPHPETQVWITGRLKNLVARFGDRAGLSSLYLSGVARLKSGISPEEAERDLDRLVRTLPDVYPDVTVEQLDRIGLHTVISPLKDTVVGSVRTELLLLLGAAGFLLLITWANTANLTLVRSERKRKDVAVERAIGATERQLAGRFFSEGVVLSVLGGALGLVLAYVAVEARFGFEPGQIPRLRDVHLGATVLAVSAGLAALTAVLLGAISFLNARKPNLANALTGATGRTTAGRTAQSGRRLLVGLQIALALTLLIGSALMARSYWRLAQTELGFEAESALTFFLPLPGSEYRAYGAAARVHDAVLDRIRALPGVESAEAATVAAFPLTPVPDYLVDRVSVANRAPVDSAAAPNAFFGFATSGYFRAMGIPLLQGRTFQTGDWAREAPAVILSESLARALFGAADPIGRRVRWASTGEAEYTVVGVVGAVPGRAIREGPSMALYFPNVYPVQSESPPLVPREMQYVVRTSLPPSSLVPAIRQSIHEVDSKLLMARIGTVEGLVVDSMARTRLFMLLLLVGAGTALLLGVIGIYGVLAYSVRQRTSELGIRLALGASPGNVIGMVVRQGAFIALAGIALGLGAAYALTRFLSSLLYEVSPTDPWAYAVAAALLFVVALAASYVPARRAGRIDPARALQAE